MRLSVRRLREHHSRARQARRAWQTAIRQPCDAMRCERPLHSSSRNLTNTSEQSRTIITGLRRPSMMLSSRSPAGLREHTLRAAWQRPQVAPVRCRCVGLRALGRGAFVLLRECGWVGGHPNRSPAVRAFWAPSRGPRLARARGPGSPSRLVGHAAHHPSAARLVDLRLVGPQSERRACAARAAAARRPRAARHEAGSELPPGALRRGARGGSR